MKKKEQEQPKPREIALPTIARERLVLLHNEAQLAQRRVTEACDSYAAAHGEKPARRYDLSADGTKLILVDTE